MLCSYSTSILLVPFIVGVDTHTIFLFQKVVSLLVANNKGSPSFPAVAGYLSISSASSILIGLLAKLEGLLAPTIVTCPPGNIFCNIVFPLVLDLSSTLSCSIGVSLIIGEILSFEKASAICIVG